MPSKTETILQTLTQILADHCSAPVERNSALPEEVPASGLIVVYDGDPGQSEKALGGFESVYYEHVIDIVVFVEEGVASIRDTVFDGLISEIKTALRSHPDLGGEVFGLTYDHPKSDIIPVVGGAAIKSAKFSLRADYEDPVH